MRVGVRLPSHPAVAAELAQAAEAAGADSVWSYEAVHTAFVSAALAAQATRRVTVGTAIALAFVRNPVLTGMTAMDLQLVSRGRFVLGLGTQVGGIISSRYGESFQDPVARAVEYVEIVRRVAQSYRGQPAEPFRGDHYNVSFEKFAPSTPLTGAELPIVLAAVNRKLTAKAAEIGVSLIGHPIAPPSWIRAQHTMFIGAGGMPGAHLHSATVTVRAEDQTAADARFDAAREVAMYLTTRAYGTVIEHLGYDSAEIRRALRDRLAAGDEPGMVRCLPTTLVDELAIYGDPDECLDKLRRIAAEVDHLILIAPSLGRPDQDVVRGTRRIIDSGLLRRLQARTPVG